MLARPRDVFANQSASCLGFAVIEREYANDAAKFKLARDPTPAQLVTAVLGNPPRSTEKAEEVFSYLSTQAPRELRVLARRSGLSLTAHALGQTFPIRNGPHSSAPSWFQ